MVYDETSDTCYTCGQDVSPDFLQWVDSFGLDKDSKIGQCELLAVLCAVLTFDDLFRNRDILFWTDNVATLKACVDGYCRQPEMAALANGLHLPLGRLGACPTYEHVPGLANIADIPSRTPFRALGTTFILDPALMNDADRHTISQVKPVFREARLPSTATLRAATSDPSVWSAPPT
jgi:hypothetical protein